MDFGGFILFIALAVSGIVLLILTILVRSYREKFAILLAINVVALLVLGGWLYKVYWLDEPLPGFAARGDLQSVQTLLNRGASPNSDGIDGVERAIVAAAESGNAEIVALLIKKGADINLTDGDGRTALDVATQKGFTNIVTLLTNSHESIRSAPVFADEKTTEKPIPEQEKKRIARVIKEALSDKSITQNQYDQAMVWLNSTPCNGVDRSLSETRKKELASAISKQEGVEKVDVYQSFKNNGWTIVYVNTHISDEPYLFYSGDPVKAKRPITAWSGAAFVFETSEIKDWVLKNAHGIPDKLASCFAWHVTLNRD